MKTFLTIICFLIINSSFAQTVPHTDSVKIDTSKTTMLKEVVIEKLNKAVEHKADRTDTVAQLEHLNFSLFGF